MTEVHPAAAARDGRLESLADALEALLDDSAYAAASAEALEVAHRHGLTAFGTRLVALVEEAVRR
jgi:hypothetical protein